MLLDGSTPRDTLTQYTFSDIQLGLIFDYNINKTLKQKITIAGKADYVLSRDPINSIKFDRKLYIILLYI